MAQKSAEGRAGAGGDDVGRERLNGFDAAIVDLGDAAARTDHLAEKGAFPGVTFHQMNAQPGCAIAPENGEHESGKSGAAAEIEKRARVRRNQGKKLGRIENVAAPNVGETGGAHQINAGLPSLKGGDQNLEPPYLLA